MNATNDLYKQYPPARRDVPYYLIARDILHFNDGWEEVRVEITDVAPGLLSLTIQNIGTFDEDPERLPRVIYEVTLGPLQSLALLDFLQRHESIIRKGTEAPTSR